ncbi:MAG TPA: hypothetical protein ENJ95_10875 [Bacteroidetes bacterium]|nr:hypothetical protein [Bacteroidota bacterium]
MKKLLPYLTTLLLLAFAACKKEETYQVPAGLLRGLSFEKNTEIDLGHYASPGTDYNFTMSSLYSFDGTHSLRILSHSLDNHDPGYWYFQFYDLVPGKPLKVKLRVKTFTQEGKGVEIWMYSNDDLGYNLEDKASIPESTKGEWITVELSTDANIPDNTDNVDIYMVLLEETQGEAYFDKLEIFTGGN